MTDEQGRFNASRFFNKKKQIVEMQDSYAKAMSPFGLCRGISKDITYATHQTLHEWKIAECERLKKEIAELTENIFADEQNRTEPLDSKLFDMLR